MFKCGLRGTWKEVGRTERIKNTEDPEWQNTFNLQFNFHEKQVTCNRVFYNNIKLQLILSTIIGLTFLDNI